MKLSDIVALAKNGYTVADIKELVALGEDSKSEPSESEGKGVESELSEKTEESEQDVEDTARKSQDGEEIVSRETLLEKVKTLESKLETAQRENIKMDKLKQDVKTAEELFADMIGSMI